MFVLQTLQLFAICLLWINVEGTGIKMTLLELRTSLEEFVRTTDQHITDFGNLLATNDKRKCKELWKKFEDVTTSLSAGILLTKALQAHGYITRLLNSAKSQRIPPVLPHRMFSIGQYMNTKWEEIEEAIAELRSKLPNVVH
ncbi:hypothetical protein D915_007579 [Fasciola hepatica]|uniref:Uncharacterized protein n=1 Tax=Fasciola hepatica TaxID=6192 RepID=A0A2H1BU78_FASHE|nr:hypothetical protein D915_007579 [Fasciola hepatica]